MLSETNTGSVQQSGHRDDQSHSLVMINKPHVNNQQTLKKVKGVLGKSIEKKRFSLFNRAEVRQNSS